MINWFELAEQQDAQLEYADAEAQEAPASEYCSVCQKVHDTKYGPCLDGEGYYFVL